MKRLAPVVFALGLAACASPPPPAASVSVSVSASASASASAPAPAPGRPLDLASACLKDVPFYLGEQPGDGQGQAVTLHAGGTIPLTRRADGTLVVWVVDDKGGGLASVHVSRRMSHVTLDAACTHLDAR